MEWDKFAQETLNVIFPQRDVSANQTTNLSEEAVEC